MKNPKVLALLKSRRFWVAAAGLVTVVASDTIGLQLDTDQLVSLATIVVAWIIGDTVRETT